MAAAAREDTGQESAQSGTPWRGVRLPRTRTEVSGLILRPSSFQEPTPEPVGNKRSGGVVHFLGGPGPPPDIEDESTRNARSAREIERRLASNPEDIDPKDVMMRNLTFQRDLAIESRETIQVSIYLQDFDVD